MVDEQTRTTFIPKQQLVKPRREERKTSFLSGGILSVIAWILIGVAIAASLGVFLYAQLLKANIRSMAESISRAEKLFDPGLIVEFKELDIRLTASEELLEKHLDFAEFFESLEATTLPDIAYDSFRFDARGEGPIVSMTGEASRFTPIALQSDLYGKNKFMENHIFSNFSLTDRGTVTFDLSFQINEKELVYTGERVRQSVPSTEEVSSEETITEEELEERIISEDEKLYVEE